MKTRLISKLISLALVCAAPAAFGQRAVMVNSNNGILAYPTNFWTINASNARTGLGLGSAATNPAYAFQPSSTMLSNLASSNGGNLTNISISNVIGVLATNGNGAGLTNLTASNITGTIAISKGGSGATNAANARTNIGLGWSALTNTSAGPFLNALGFNSAVVVGGANDATLEIINDEQDTINIAYSSSNGGSSSVSFFTNAITINGDINFTTITQKAVARTNLGLGWSALTNTNAATSLLGFTTNGQIVAATNVAFTNSVNFGEIKADSIIIPKTGAPLVVMYTSNGSLNASIGGIIVSPSPPTVSIAGGYKLELSSGANLNFAGGNSISNAPTINFANTTNAAQTRTNLGLGWSALTNTNVTNFRSNIGLGWSALTNINSELFNTAIGLGVSNVAYFSEVGVGRTTDAYTMGGIAGIPNPNSGFSFKQSGIPFLTISNLTGTNGGALIFHGTVGAATTRTNLGLGATNDVSFSNIIVGSFFVGGSDGGFVGRNPDGKLRLRGTNVTTSIPAFFGWNGNESTAMSAEISRTNLGLGWSALTNTNTSGFNSSLYGSGTNPVLVSTNGEVVSPTNFWQVSPADTRIQSSQPLVNATNTATNARNLYFYSLAISTTGVTNTVQLPTNSATLLGDIATVIHAGPTSSTTAVRSEGAGTNLTTLNQVREAVRFVYESSGWRFADNIFYGEPISFSGTNATANAATSRTNLGIPLVALTNTSNDAVMRALSGSTNASHPFSGSISVTGTNNTNTLVFSNGILQSVQ